MTEQLADGRHDHVFDQRRDYLSEGRADNHADRQIYDVATHGELLELFQHGRSPLFYSIKIFDGPGAIPSHSKDCLLRGLYSKRKSKTDKKTAEMGIRWRALL